MQPRCCTWSRCTSCRNLTAMHHAVARPLATVYSISCVVKQASENVTHRTLIGSDSLSSCESSGVLSNIRGEEQALRLTGADSCASRINRRRARNELHWFPSIVPGTPPIPSPPSSSSSSSSGNCSRDDVHGGGDVWSLLSQHHYLYHCSHAFSFIDVSKSHYCFMQWFRIVPKVVVIVA